MKNGMSWDGRKCNTLPISVPLPTFGPSYGNEYLKEIITSASIVGGVAGWSAIISSRLVVGGVTMTIT